MIYSNQNCRLSAEEIIVMDIEYDPPDDEMKWVLYKIGR